MSENRSNQQPTQGLLSNEDGSLAAPMFLFVVSIALCLSGKWIWGVALGIGALVIAVCNAAGTIEDKEKHEIRFNVMQAADIFKVMLRWEAKYLFEYQEKKQEDVQVEREGRVIVLAGLGVLVRRYEQGHKTDICALVCQEAVFLAFRRFNKDNEIMIAALSLLSIIGKNEKVRQRVLLEPDTFGLDMPVGVITKALVRAKYIENDEEREMQAAELQRKGFLSLGVLSDKASDLARKVAQEGGVEAALDAIDWFRHHADVVNWALWLIFIVCYEDPSNKIAVIQHHGIPKIIEAMHNCPDRLDVSRHGVAILFDLMREETATCQPNEQIDIWRIRETARSAGLHDVVLEILERYSEASDVVMMGNELLAGTGYTKTTLSPSVQIEELD
eukprot:CAMPEP_0198136606 /NCGR_PEP_ID=MMETSP1443-20131203/245_1 /TAXON_ID=186043 /ORGANISM="Entomoneis sp., Strain CCMP2396" /LENGTH=387 /DNA_ID=CAMNT_0043797853 /DNA_START=173 /DNA_END=1336 /DNA_ORIENTATION=-